MRGAWAGCGSRDSLRHLRRVDAARAAVATVRRSERMLRSCSRRRGAWVSGSAILAIPIPPHVALLGVALFQQPFAWVGGANPAGVLLGSSMRGTVGRAY
jgi:hypothetical protein